MLKAGMALMAAGLVWPASTSEDPIRLTDYKGKVVLLNFWATTCGGCKTEIPWFIEFERKYRSSGLVVIGVALDEEGWKVVKPFMKTAGMNYRVVLGDDALAGQWGVEAMPMTVWIGRDGEIVSRHTGLMDREECEKQIAILLDSHRK